MGSKRKSSDMGDVCEGGNREVGMELNSACRKLQEKKGQVRQGKGRNLGRERIAFKRRCIKIHDRKLSFNPGASNGSTQSRVRSEREG
jgi:hypothetical protein